MSSHFKHETGKYKELTPRGRERRSGLASEEEVGFHAIFYELYLGTQRGLGDASALRRSAETALFGDCYKRYKVTELGPFVHDCHNQSTRRPGAGWLSVFALDMVRLRVD